jgi:hypothetical protein
LIKVALIAVSLTACLFAWAEELTCDQLNQAWTDRYHREFKVQWPKTQLQCPSGSAKIAQALHDVYSADDSHNFYATARNLTIGTRYLGTCDKDTVAWMSAEGLFTICDRFFSADPEKRASTIFHEAAHARTTDPKHVKCDHGDVTGQIACDEVFTGNYDTGSGYNWEVLYLRYVKLNPKANDMTRWVSEGHLKFLLNNRFNRITAEELKNWSR